MKRASVKPSSSGKMKQLSLMSFFKPQQAKGASNPSIAKSSPVKNDSDKDDDSSRIHSTPLTSDTESTILSIQKMSFESSPLKSKQPSKSATTIKDIEEVKEVPVAGNMLQSSPVSKRNASAVDLGTELEVSPVVKRRAAAKSVSYIESDSEDEGVKVNVKKRKIIESDDEEDEFKIQDEDEDDDDDMSDFIVPDEDDSDVKSEEDDDEEIVKSKPKRKSSPNTKPSTKSVDRRSSREGETGGALGAKFNSNSTHVPDSIKTAPKPISKASITSPLTKKNFNKENEERYQWLVNIKDANKKSIDDPEYDSRTLYVPSSAWAKFTNFEKQYWEIKSKMWDTVVFFKKGKFYELYENDAIIANTKFDLKIAGGGRANMKLAGIPEMSFEYWAKEFVSNGYKVAKVDQVETLLAKEMRGNTKEEKIIKRELTSVLTGGTLTDLNMITDDMAIYCLSIKQDGKKLGLAFVDTSTSELQMIEIEEDDIDECNKLDTIITQIKPKEIICEKNNLSSIPMKILKHSSSGIIWNYLNPETEFWDYDTTLEELVKSKYYEAIDLDDYSNYPKVLLQFKDEFKVGFNAFGGLLHYLKNLKLDESIMTLGNIHQYDEQKTTSTTNLLLDGITLSNLEILNNSFDGTDKGTLFKLMNRAITPFGKRMLKTWILNPLFQVEHINSRYDSVEFLMNNGEFRDILERGLGDLPDLERLIARVHGKTLRFKDFLKVVEGFERIEKLILTAKVFDLKGAGVLESYIDRFPRELSECIKDWSDAFCRDNALNDIVVPETGIDAEFDDSQAKMNNLEKKLGEYLKQYKKEYKSHEICFRDSGKEIFLIEMPTKVKNIPKDWQQMGSTSKVKRFWSPEVKKLVRSLMEQRELHKMLCEGLRFRMYEKFDKNYDVWISTIKKLAQLDCLVALTRTSESIGYPSCRPEFDQQEAGNASLDFKELRHPCFVGDNFVPNDVKLGGGCASIGLLTGANAAGKSTLMRTTGLAVILSQIGCLVPAELAKLTPIDKIMTRLGANDNIMQGKSTFFVELSETKKILDNATPNSLVILDELGRGGSSSDGYAIAESVLYHLSTHIQSLGFFATHYGTLGLSFKTHPKIMPLRMAIIADSAGSRNITFLYKLEEGSASGSFGMNVASMCGIQEDIVMKAEIAAKEYEHTSKLKKLTEIILHSGEDGSSMNLSLGLQSDFSWVVNNYEELTKSVSVSNENVQHNAISTIFKMIDSL